MTPDDATAALDGVMANPYQGASHSTMTTGWYGDLGLKLYYGQDMGLKAVSVDARRGPQVLADGMGLVGRVPSQLEQWMTERAEIREPFTELFYLPTGDPASYSLGVMLCVQRMGDVLVTRPVLVPGQAFDDITHWLPREAWKY